MSLSAFSLASLKTQKRAKSMYLHPTPEVEIDTSLIKQIGNYKLGEEIGSGAFGKVILGLHMITGEKVAIKILDKFILSQTPEDYELVKQELSILKIVKHKYIVQLYEILETPQHIFIIMEYCEGQDIMDYILTRNRLSEDESLKYFQQLINALYYLHSQNITHRDIKIDNLLLDRNLDLKLIDFGLSTKYRDDKLLNQPCGTVVYAAPEVLDCREYHGMLADVWSSGIVLFGMLSGFLPFGDPDDEVNKKLVLQGKIEIPKFFGRQVTDLLKHMLDLNPLTRYTLEEIMAHPWFNKNRFRLIPGITIGINNIPVDEKIVNLCVTYNVDKNKVRNSVINNKFNTESSLYYLLVKKLKACGNDSVSDLCSNKFIKYIFEDNNRFNYFNEIKNNMELNIQEEITKDKDKKKEKEKTKEKEKEKEKERKKVMSQLNDYLTNLEKRGKIYNYNYNSKDNDRDTDLSAAPGLINEYNFKKYNNNNNYNYNLINIENNEYSLNNSRNYDDSDLINVNEKENSSTNNSHLRINLGETEFNKNGIDLEDDDDFINDKIIPATHRVYTKGKLDPNRLAFLNKEENNKLNQNNKVNDIEGKGNKYNRSANNKKEKRYINEVKENKKMKNNCKINLIRKSIKKNNKPPLTSRNEFNTIDANTNTNTINNNYHIYSTQVTNYKKNKRKIIPIQRDFGKNTKNNNKKENTLKLNFRIKPAPDKKESNLLTKDTTKKNMKQSKIVSHTLNIPPLNINNKNIKVSYKKLDNKRKRVNTNLYDNSNDFSNKYASNQNKSIDSRNKVSNTQRNNELSSNLFKTIYQKNNNEKNIVKTNQNNMKNFLKNKINSKSIDSRKKFIIDSTNKEKKINKSNVMNLLDNFHLYQKSNNKNINNIKNNINKTSVVTNNNSKYKYKKDFSYVHSSLLTFDNNQTEDPNKNNGFNTDRTRNLFNLKKQSCFEKENNFTGSNNTRIKSKKKIKNNNGNNMNIPKNYQNDLIRMKIKDYYNKKKKVENLNIKDINNISYSIGGNKVNSSIVQTTLNTINSNTNNNQKNHMISTISNEKYNNTSRINVTLRNKSIKERNLNNLHKKMNTSILSSIQKLKEIKKLKPKLINSKINSDNNNSKLNSLVKIGYIPNQRIKVNHSLSKNKKQNDTYINNNAINNSKQIKKSHHLESSVIVYRKKSPFKIRDLSDSPRQKYLNEKTRNNRIPWKIKKKGIDEKLDGLSIYNRYINQFQLKNNNPFKKRHLLKKKFKNKKEKNNSFLINSKVKSNRYSLNPSTSNQKTLNISYSNYNNGNNNNNNISKNNENGKYNPNGTSQEFYKHTKNKINSNNFSINPYQHKNSVKIKKIKNLNKINLQKRNDRTMNSNNYENNNHNLTQNNNNNSLLKFKEFNKSISFGSLQSFDDEKEKESNKNEINGGVRNKNLYEFEEPFDLSCLFITNKKINELYSSYGNKIKKFGFNLNQKNNVINCSKNGKGFQFSINKFKNKKYEELYVIHYTFDKKKNNKINEIFSKIINN